MVVALGRPARAQEESELGTPREGLFSSIWLGLDVGYASMADGAATRAAIGNGATLGLRLGVALWDVLPITLGWAGLFLKDRDPFSESVMECRRIGSSVVDCDQPEEKKSSISGMHFTFESGYQRRFRPARSLSLLPSLSLGYLLAGGSLQRAVECEDCPAYDVEGVDQSGLYLSPSLRMTLGRAGNWALSVRSQIFLTGDLTQMTIGGLEFGLP